MNTGLLSCADTDCLSVFDKADRIGLCVLQRDQRNFQIADRLCRQFPVLCYDVGKQFIVDRKFLTSLLECDAVNLLALKRCRTIVLVHLNYDVIPVLLGTEKLQRLICIARCYHAV